MKIVVFCLKFHWNVFQTVQLQLLSINSDNSLVPNVWWAIIWTNDGLVYWHIMYTASMKMTHKGLDVLVNWIIIVSGNGFSQVWHQSISWTKAQLLPIEPSGTNFSEILIHIQNYSTVIVKTFGLLPDQWWIWLDFADLNIII